MSEYGSKSILAMAIALFGFLVNAITEIILVLALLMVIDYVTGMIASKQKGKWESGKALDGAVKKCGYIFLMLITVLFDYVLINVGKTIGVSINIMGIFTLLVACWLISTELISIIENLGYMGVPIPTFLRKAFSKLKDTSESIGENQVNELAISANEEAKE